MDEGHLEFLTGDGAGNWVVLAPYWDLHGVAGQVLDTLRRLAAQEMPARHEQIGQRAQVTSRR
jgi:hypothetical protein